MPSKLSNNDFPALGSSTASMTKRMSALAVSGAAKPAAKSAPKAWATQTSASKGALAPDFQHPALASGPSTSSRPETDGETADDVDVPDEEEKEDDPSKRDESAAQIRVLERQDWDEEALKYGCKLMHDGMSCKLAAREANVLMVHLKDYFDNHWCHDDDEYDDGCDDGYF